LNITQALQLARTLQLDGLESNTWLLHVTNQPRHDRAWLLTHEQHVLTSEQTARFKQGLQRLQQGEPLAYLVGIQAFHGLDLQVTPAVLVPRADTETLVDWALSLPLPNTGVSVLDLGTGCGAIALALKHHRPTWTVHAVDQSAPALQVAQANANRLQLDVQFSQSNWLQSVNGELDLIVANPPYIAEGDPHLPGLVHEPISALVSGPQGLNDLQTIADQARAHLKPGAWLLLEHGYNQAEAVCQILKQKGYTDVQSRNDLAGIVRCSGGQRAEVK
jgi:release factor glutamine methyltransferase